MSDDIDILTAKYEEELRDLEAEYDMSTFREHDAAMRDALAQMTAERDALRAWVARGCADAIRARGPATEGT